MSRSQRCPFDWLEARMAVLVTVLGCCLQLPGQQLPVFEAEAALMEVEVRVTNGKGQPVTDLRKDDFELLENGRPQAISTFEFIAGPETRLDVVVPRERETPGESASAQPEAEMGRSTFVYVATRGRREDRQRIYEAVSTFVDENLVPGVLVSIEGSPFTSKRSELRERLREMLVRGSGGQTGASFIDTLAVHLAREDIQYSTDLEALIGDANEEFAEDLEEIADRAAFYRRLRMYEYIDLIRALGIYPGRKVVVLFSTGLPVDEDNLDIMKVLEDEATRNRVRFYVSDVSRLTAEPPGGDAERRGNFDSLVRDADRDGFLAMANRRQDNQDGLYELARRTGGRAVLNSNDFGEVFEVVDRESRDYYLIGYYPSDTEQRGRLRRIQVRVNRKGLRVSHQRGYYEDRPFKMMSRSERNLRMHQALTFDTPYTELPLRADHELFRNSDGSSTLVYAVGLHTRDIPAASVKRGKKVKLTVVAQATANRAKGAPPSVPVIDERRFEMTVDSVALERLSDNPNSWLHYGSQMRLEPGDYDWKVIVRDDHSGVLGSFQTEVRIPRGRARLAASSLLLTGRIDDVAAQGTRKASAKLPEDVLEVDGSRFFATAVKAFLKGDAIYVLYDAYEPGNDSLADPPPAKLALYKGERPLKQLPVEAHKTVAQPEAGRIRYLAVLGTSGLDAGQYTLAALVPSSREERLVIHRDFQVVEPAPQ